MENRPLDLLGAIENGDITLIAGDDMSNIAAVGLAIILSDPEQCVARTGRVPRALRSHVALRLTETAHLRVHRGRISSAIGYQLSTISRGVHRSGRCRDRP